MRISALLLVSSISIFGCSPAEPEANSTQMSEAQSMNVPTSEEIQAESARLNAWFDKKYEEQVMQSPTQLAYLGRDERQNEIDDFSEAGYDAYVEMHAKQLAELKSSFDYDKLNEETKISYDLWVYLAEQIAEEDKFRYNTYVFEQMGAMHSFFPQLLIAIHRVENQQDMENYLSRISESARAIKQLIEFSKTAAEKGVRPPYFAFDAVISESKKIISGQPFDETDNDSDLWADAKSKIDGLVSNEAITQKSADELLAKIKTALLNDFKPAYEALIAWQEEDKVNAGTKALGAGDLPDGKNYYNERLSNQTTTSLSADEIHEIGLKDVARLREEMKAVQQEFGFEGTLQEFFVFLRDTKDDERLYYPNTDEGRQGYIDDATAAINKIKEQLPNYFGILPKADMVVKRVEAFREQDGAAQHYMPSTPDGSRPGVYYAHLSDMTAMPKRELEVIAYHEGLPGHHMQLAISLELSGLPTFRKQSYLNAYGEGWALYSELLAKEMPGTYEDPLSDFGRLGSEMWRAIRLVVDTGLHAKGWSEEQAIRYFQENSAITNEQGLSEVRRYLVLPGQATGYKIGMIKIQELRKRAEDTLGDKFDIRAFHDTILGGGGLPLTILERKVDAWIAASL
ncbi:DUF885 domain-containing protein [Brumicola blandensis]|uniref:DUF885 domain-containing protein n=1 Tax=Brumicola blandensis TaxID=3075611 RepID=A0AAW8R3Z4_9ALTE|nr:DUF885 domain-containing protein [Alteromonas sp. W409]MDT0583764.1 DUF885 domain-containing protein [Alteromonas sp. W409]